MLTHKMFTQVLRSEHCTPLLQEQAFRYAVKSGDEDLMCVLLACTDLPAELDEALGQRTELEVLSAWSNRAGRTTEEILARFAKEKRATLLLDLAETTGLPQELYHQLAARKSVTVNWALLQNASVDTPLKLELAGVLGSGMTLRNGGVDGKLRPIRTVSDEVFVAFVDSLENPVAVRSLVRPTSGETRLRALARAAARTRRDEMDNWHAYSALTEILERDDLTDELFEEFAAVADGIIAEDSAVESTVYTRRLITELGRLRAKRATDVEALFQAVADAGSDVALDAAIANYRQIVSNLQMMRDDQTLAKRALDNVHAAERHVRDLYRHMSVKQAREIGRRAIHVGDRGLVRMVFECSTYVGGDIFSDLYRENENPEEFMAWALGDDTTAPGWAQRSAVVRENPALALRLLPAVSTMPNSDYADLIAQLLAEKLGGSANRWDTFTGLSVEWTGSFVDLVETAVHLSSE